MQRSRAPTKGLGSPMSNRPPPPAARWAGVRCGSDGVRWSDRRTPLGAAVRHAVPRSTAMILGEG